MLCGFQYFNGCSLGVKEWKKHKSFVLCAINCSRIEGVRKNLTNPASSGLQFYPYFYNLAGGILNMGNTTYVVVIKS